MYYYALMIVIGIIGIIFMYITLRWIWVLHNGVTFINRMAELGSYSLAIYLMQGIVVEVSDCYKEQLMIDSCILTIVAVSVSIGLTALISLLIIRIKKSHKISAYLLGK